MDKNITANITKKAWMDNWKDHSVDEVMSIFNYPRVQRLLETFLSILPERGKILEGGCGLGPWVIKLSELEYDITGVDYDKDSIDKIRHYNPRIPLYVSDVQDMPFEDGYFDAYMSLGVLEHFYEGPEKAIAEANRVISPGGIFMVMLPYLNLFERIKLPVKKLQKNSKIRKILGKPEKTFYYECYFGIKQITNLLEAGGFYVETAIPIDHIFSLVSFSRVFRDRKTYDGENELAIKCADFLSRIMPWQSAGSSLLVARKNRQTKT
jgi:SAM-dependent methyltransferase